MKIRKITLSAVLIAIGVLTGSIVYIPVGGAKCFPVQHTINVLAAVFAGPSNGVATAFCISLLRNMLGKGTLLAFPGSMIGAFLAAIIFKKTKNLSLTVLGEVIGTGILGALLAFPMAKFVLGKDVAAFVYVYPFLISTIGGSIIAYLAIKALLLSKAVKLTKAN